MQDEKKKMFLTLIVSNAMFQNNAMSLYRQSMD